MRRRAPLVVVLPALMAAVAAGCRPTVRPTCDVPDQGNLTIEATDRLNPDERGEALREHCDRLLKQAEARVEKLTIGGHGTPRGTEPLDPE